MDLKKYKNQLKAFLLYAHKLCGNFLIKIKKEKDKYLNILLKISILLLIVLVGFASCSQNQKVISKNIASIFSISDDIRTYFSDKPSYWGLSTNYVLEKSIISQNYVSNGKIVLKNNKEISIGQGYQATPVTPNAKIFDIVLKGLNKAECISYLEAEISKTNLVKLYSISLINNNINLIFMWGNTNTPLPIKKYTGRSVCDADNNTIVWSIY